MSNSAKREGLETAGLKKRKGKNIVDKAIKWHTTSRAECSPPKARRPLHGALRRGSCCQQAAG